ncbi:MAG TPA: hypothetical protein VM261_13775 [Kofleriaceae bacterium]|nr:hypothetical protein [Kofleriaceae bacterium]
MGIRAALFAVIMLGGCGGGGKAKTTATPEPGGGSDSSTATKPVGPPPMPQPVPVDVAELEAWEGNVEEGPVKVAAADVDGEVLRRVLVPAAIEIIAVRTDGLVTGRVTGSRVGALSALTAVSPGLKLGPRARLSGKGPAMTIDAVGMDSRELFQSFADSLKTNVVVLGPAQKLTVSAKAPSVQKLMDEVAKTAGLVVEKPVAGVTVLRPKASAKIGKLPAKGEKLDLDVRGARPGHVIALVHGLVGAESPPGDCSAGEPATVRLKAVPAAAAEKLVARLGGDTKVTACKLTPDSSADVGKLELVASATSSKETLWLAMDGETAIVTDSKDAHWSDAVNATVAVESDIPSDARLAATVLGVGNGVAIVEIHGQFHVMEALAADKTGPGVVRVAAGEVEIADAAGTKRTLKLSKRP